MKSMSGPRRAPDPILADIQRAFVSGYFERREMKPCKVATVGVLGLYQEIANLPQKERRRLLHSWSTPLPTATGRVKLSQVTHIGGVERRVVP